MYVGKCKWSVHTRSDSKLNPKAGTGCDYYALLKQYWLWKPFIGEHSTSLSPSFEWIHPLRD